MTRLFLTGNWPLFIAVTAASVLGGSAWILYQKELAGMEGKLARVPALLRATAIFLLVLMLSGPTLQRRETTGQLAPLLLVVDGSQSMGLEDIDPQSHSATFDRLSRLGSHLFLGKSQSLLARLHAQFDVRLLFLDSRGLNSLWSAAEGLDRIPQKFPDASGETTDLHQSLFQTLNACPELGRLPPHSTIVLFSDGQHNAGPSPLELGADFETRAVSVFTVGMGSEKPPPDLALQRVEAPARLHPEDRLHGKIFITDDMPPGLPFEVIVSIGGKEAWRKTLQTSAVREKIVPFEFPLKPFSGGDGAAPAAGKGRRLTATVEIPALSKEVRATNNQATFRVQLAATKRTMLLIDGRPRWETRYIRTFFERNPQWVVNTLLPSSNPGSGMFARGTGTGAFPASQKDLNEYDVIFLGECERAAFRDEELEWLSTFVSERGGSLILLDGPRGDFQSLDRTPLSTAFPVRLPPPDGRAAVQGSSTRYRLVPVGRAPQLPAFSLADVRQEESPRKSAVWSQLAAPRWMSPCEPLPGSEVLLEATRDTEHIPLLVFRSFGAGRVLYSAFDETWRWRVDVGGLHQERFWNQLIDWLTEEPFTAENAVVALDSGEAFYKPGSPARLRAKLRDASAPASPDLPQVQGQLIRNGSLFASFALPSDPTHHRTFAFKTQPLPSGSYVFRLADASLPPAAAEVSADFEVETPASEELKNTHQNVGFLQKLASDFHGKYLRESEIDQLPTELSPRQQGQTTEIQIPLWSGFPWFFAVMFLLGSEWILRKKLGLV